jgi:hypothetical protein
VRKLIATEGDRKLYDLGGGRGQIEEGYNTSNVQLSRALTHGFWSFVDDDDLPEGFETDTR